MGNWNHAWGFWDSNLFLVCLKVNYRFLFFLSFWKVQLVDALFRSLFFFQSIYGFSIWRMNRPNLHQKAVSWCQWFCFLFVCLFASKNLYRNITSNAINFNWIFVLVMYQCYSIYVFGHVLFSFFLLFSLFINANPYSNFVMANNGIGQPFHLQQQKK